MRLHSSRRGWITGLAIAVAALALPKLYFQFRPAPVFVGVVAPVPDQFVQVLLKYKPNLTDKERVYERGVAYTEAAERKVSRTDLAQIRAALAWGRVLPYRVEAIMIHSPTSVTASVRHGHIFAVDLSARGGFWHIQEEHRGIIDHY